MDKIIIEFIYLFSIWKKEKMRKMRNHDIVRNTDTKML